MQIEVSYLLVDKFCNDITSVHINGTDGHNFLSVSLAQFSDQHCNESIQLLNLFLEVILQGIFITFLQATKCNVDLSCPPNLGTTQGNLNRGITSVKDYVF